MDIINFSGKKTPGFLQNIKNRTSLMLEMESGAATAKTIELFGEPLSAIEVVRKILNDVNKKGFEAISDYAEKLDGFRVTEENVIVSDSEIKAAEEKVEDSLKLAIQVSRDNIQVYQERICPKMGEQWAEDGLTGIRTQPLRCIGSCVPGAAAPLISTVLMNIIPAKVAGVEETIVVTPPNKEGEIHPAMLYACKVAGVEKVYRLGGVQAIALLALGLPGFQAVDKIVGPGNLFVQLAKKELFGQVDIDMFGGPSEILIIADKTAKADWLAADLLSQAEHDPMASSVLLTDSSELAEAVKQEIEKQLAELPRKDIAEESLSRYGAIVKMNSLEECISLANDFAPEHLEIVTEDPEKISKKIRNASAIFMGCWTPEAIGDYVAGPSHTLPTSGTARFFSGLSVETFIKRSSLLRYTEEAFKRDSGAGEILAEAEGLEAHRKALRIRK